MLLFICILISFTLAILPMLGWNKYVFEGAFTSCSINWHSIDHSAVFYNIFIFIFVLFLPFSFIIYCNFNTYKSVSMFKEMKIRLK